MANTNSSTLVKLISDTDSQIYFVVNFVVISTAIAIFGIVGNVMNIVVFYKQGFNSTMNISFFGLAISDLCGLSTLIWYFIFLNPLLTKSDAPVQGQEMLYLTGGVPRVYFCRTTAWITVYITAERCLSIIVPLQIKHIITPRRAKIILCLIYIMIVGAFLPEYATSYIGWEFSSARNVTILGLVFTENRSSVEGLTYILYSILGSTAFVVVIVVTVILVVQLKQKSKWRMTANTDKAKQELLSNRDRKTVAMVAMIATVLIVCYIPGAAVSMATFFAPDFSVDGVNINAYYVSWSFVCIFDTINSSINIFLYYKMSSKYRETFNQIFGSWCVWCKCIKPQLLTPCYRFMS